MHPKGAPAKLAKRGLRPFFFRQGESTGRQIMHTSAFARSTLVDSILTSSYSHLEMKVKDIWINSGQLYEGLHQGKSVRDTELLVVKDQTDYEQKLSVIQQLCDVRDIPLELRLAQEKSRQMEADARQVEAAVRKVEAEAEARKFEADARKVVRQMELELEMLKLKFEMRK